MSLRSTLWGLGMVLFVVSQAHAFTPANADASFEAFNNAFYSNVGHDGQWYYKQDTKPQTTGSGWWSYAEEIEMAEDVYDRKKSPETRDLVTSLCGDFVHQYGTLWTANKFNDDITWAVIAFSRAYQITRNKSYRDIARANFDAVYSRGWDADLGGGIWWSTDKREKNACINGPAAIAAYLIYKNSRDSSYLAKSKNLYAWERATLFDPSTGRTYDNINASGVISQSTYTYNQGTFIGAANYLGHVDEATLAANYTRDHMGTDGILPGSSVGGDGGGFDGIFLRWMARFMKDRRMQSSYLPWLQQNANAAWNVRRSDNLSWCNWSSPTPSGILHSFDCAGSVIALQVVPADQK